MVGTSQDQDAQAVKANDEDPRWRRAKNASRLYVVLALILGALSLFVPDPYSLVLRSGACGFVINTALTMWVAGKFYRRR
jgi:hypothetical protein